VGWWHTELAAFGPEVLPLNDVDALAAYRLSEHFSSRTRYGLNETVFQHIERLDVEEPNQNSRQWLAERLGEDELLLTFAKDEVFQVPASFFLDHWQDMFCPSRDDVVILPIGGGWALFYCHEDEFEFARTPTPHCM